jgi:DNA-binding CsgD family transcriptional regulator
MGAATGLPATRGCCCGHEHMTRREVEILLLVAAGQTTRDIAGALDLSPRTVEGHIGSILRRTRASTRSAAVTTAFDAGILQCQPGPRWSGRTCLPSLPGI